MFKAGYVAVHPRLPGFGIVGLLGLGLLAFGGFRFHLELRG